MRTVFQARCYHNDYAKTLASKPRVSCFWGSPVHGRPCSKEGLQPLGKLWAEQAEGREREPLEHEAQLAQRAETGPHPLASDVRESLNNGIRLFCVWHRLGGEAA